MRFVLALLLFAGCDLTSNSPEVDPECVDDCRSEAGDPFPESQISVSLDIWGAWGQWDALRITSDGYLIRPHWIDAIPSLIEKLPPARHDSLFAALEPLRFLQRSYWDSGCADGRWDRIEFRDEADGGKLLRRVLANCVEFFVDRDSTGEAGQIKDAVTLLRGISSDVYARKAPWIGLTGRPYLDRAAYTASDTLRIRRSIVNPTDVPRTVYFTHSRRTDFRIMAWGDNGARGWQVWESPRAVACYGPATPCDVTRATIAPGDSVLLRDLLATAAFMDPASDGDYVLVHHALAFEIYTPSDYGRLNFTVR